MLDPVIFNTLVLTLRTLIGKRSKTIGCIPTTETHGHGSMHNCCAGKHRGEAPKQADRKWDTRIPLISRAVGVPNSFPDSFRRRFTQHIPQPIPDGSRRPHHVKGFSRGFGSFQPGAFHTALHELLRFRLSQDSYLGDGPRVQRPSPGFYTASNRPDSRDPH